MRFIRGVFVFGFRIKVLLWRVILGLLRVIVIFLVFEENLKVL